MKRGLGVALALAALFALEAPEAWAQTEAARAEAKIRLAEARDLYDRGDYKTALEKLNEAYRLVPSPKILFSFGQAYRGLARDVEALESFQRFLGEAKDAEPALRTEATRYVAELRKRVSTIEIASDVDGAEVTLDGRPLGQTPLRGPLFVTPGPHQVLVERQGAPAFAQAVSPAPGAAVRVEARLRPPPGAPALGAPPPGPGGPPGLALTGGYEPEPPVYKKWWFWTGVGAVVAGGVLTAVLLTRDKGTPSICDCNFSPGTVQIPTP